MILRHTYSFTLNWGNRIRVKCGKNATMSTEVTPVSSFTPAIHANNAREQLLQGLRLAERQVVYFKNALAALDALERRTGYGLESLPAVKPKEFQGERL